MANRTRKDVESEIKDALGLVPGFLKSIPDRYIDAEWDLFKTLELGETLIPNKYKELMGIALHSETKCRYCTLFHTESARLHGATEDEIQEAVHYAKMSVGWSVYINGMQTDYEEFAAEMDEVGKYVKSKQSTHAH
jgi:AhpD family alkylhydroperoxidase